MTTKINVNDIQVDVNQIAEDGAPVSVKCEVFGWDYTQPVNEIDETF